MSFRYCSVCGGHLAEREHEGRLRKICDACGFVMYQNSKPTADALILQDGKILLTKRANDPGKGLWELPGGFLEDDEHPEEGLRREMHEELQVDVHIESLFGIYMGTYGDERVSTLNICYIVSLAPEAKPRAGEEIAGWEWFDLRELPPASHFAFAVAVKVLQDLQVKHSL